MTLDTFLRLKEAKRNMIIHYSLKEFSTKSYQDANTDEIIKHCGISKGSLYHYFGSKKQLYLYLLSHSLGVFNEAAKANTRVGEDFYDFIFTGLDHKLKLYQTHPLEIAFIIMASREQSLAILQEKNRLLLDSYNIIQSQFLVSLNHAITYLPIKVEYDPKTIMEALMLYIEALRNKYLEEYRLKPMAFYQNREAIKAEFKTHLDLLLYGILKEESK